LHNNTLNISARKSIRGGGGRTTKALTNLALNHIEENENEN